MLTETLAVVDVVTIAALKYRNDVVGMWTIDWLR